MEIIYRHTEGQRLLLIALLLILGTPARADDVAEAKRLYASGTKHFDLTEYEAALNDFKEGYRFRDDPVFLYNIAQCYRLLNRNDDAIKFYKNYLRRQPRASNRPEVEAKILALQEAIATQERAREQPRMDTLKPGEQPGAKAESEPRVPPPAEPTVRPTPPPAEPATVVVVAAPPPKTPIYKKWWLWTAVGAVVAVGVGVGVGVGVAASQKSSEGSSFPGVSF